MPVDMQEDALLIEAPSCCCLPLTAQSRISPWSSKMSAEESDLVNLLQVRPLLHSHNKICQEEQQDSEVSTSKGTSSVTSGPNDPTDSRVSPIGKSPSEIPFNFSHQKTPSTNAKDYRKAYTYPNMEKRALSGGGHRHLRGIPQPSSSPSSCSSSSTPHLTKPVRPKLIVLGGECCGDEKGQTTVSASSPYSKPEKELPPVSEHHSMTVRNKPRFHSVSSLVVQPSRSWESPKRIHMVKRRLRRNPKDKPAAAGEFPQLQQPLPTMPMCNLEPYLSTVTLHKHPPLSQYHGDSPSPNARMHENQSTTIVDRSSLNMQRKKQLMRTKIVNITSPWGKHK